MIYLKKYYLVPKKYLIMFLVRWVLGGHTVLLHPKNSDPIITKDGATVCRFIEFEDPFENIAAQFFKQASENTNASSGDGTTGTIVLSYSILKEAQKYLITDIPLLELKNGLERGKEIIIEALENQAKKVKNIDEIERIATISANNDEVVGKLIAKAIDIIGKDGSIVLQDGKSLNTTLETIEGFRINSGFLASQFITNERKQTLEYNEPIFFITDHELETVQQIMPILTLAQRHSRPLIIIAEEVKGQALASLLANTLRGTMPIGVVQPPSFGEERKELLKDLCVVIGAKFITKRDHRDLTKITLNDFGSAKSIETSKNYTIIMGGMGLSQNINNRIFDLKEQISVEVGINSDIKTLEKLQERITKLQSGIVIITVGGNSSVEQIEKKHRVEDALEAAKSALEQGIVVGGGCALVRASEILKDFIESEKKKENISIGYISGLNIIREATLLPFKTITENAHKKSDVLLNELLDLPSNLCYDIPKDEFVCGFEKGIIDPLKVIKNSLQNAFSVVSTLLTSNHAIVEK